MKPMTLFVACLLLFCSSQAKAQDIFLKAVRATARKFSTGDYVETRKSISFAAKEAVNDEQRAVVGLLTANVDLAEGKTEIARQGFEKIADNKELPVHVRSQAYTGIGVIYSSQGKFEEERAIYRKIYKLDEKDPFNYYVVQAQVADSFEREGKPKLARLELEKVVSLRNVDLYSLSLARLDIADIYIDEADYKSARSVLAEVILIKEALAPQAYQPDIRDNKQRAALAIARSYFLEKNYAKANEEIKNVLAIKDLTKENREKAKTQMEALEKAAKGAAPTQTAPK